MNPVGTSLIVLLLWVAATVTFAFRGWAKTTVISLLVYLVIAYITLRNLFPYDFADERTGNGYAIDFALISLGLAAHWVLAAFLSIGLLAYRHFVMNKSKRD